MIPNSMKPASDALGWGIVFKSETAPLIHVIFYNSIENWNTQTWIYEGTAPDHVATIELAFMAKEAGYDIPVWGNTF